MRNKQEVAVFFDRCSKDIGKIDLGDCQKSSPIGFPIASAPFLHPAPEVVQCTLDVIRKLLYENGGGVLRQVFANEKVAERYPVSMRRIEDLRERTEFGNKELWRADRVVAHYIGSDVDGVTRECSQGLAFVFGRDSVEVGWPELVSMSSSVLDGLAELSRGANGLAFEKSSEIARTIKGAVLRLFDNLREKQTGNREGYAGEGIKL